MQSMQSRKPSVTSSATFAGNDTKVARNRNTPSPSLDDVYFNRRPTDVNLKDFETFEPREDYEQSSNASSLHVPADMQRRYNNDMHLQLLDLDVPNQSMTLSSLTQSQYQGRSTRSYLSSLSNNQGTGERHQSSVESSQQPSARQLDLNSNLTMSNSHSQFGTEEKRDAHDDSPDFNRTPQEVSDELTVSKSDLSELIMGKAYRESRLDVDKPPFLKNQNRTFADSVIDHQLNGVLNPKNPQTALKQGSVSKTQAMLGQSQTIDATRKLTQNKGFFQPFLEAEHDDPILDNSEISELDMLTRTQISQNLNQIDPNARSRIFIPKLLQDSLTQSQITVPGSDPSNPPTKRTQNKIFRKLVDDASSINFTPEKDGVMSQNSLNWQLKSHNAQNESETTSQINTDRDDQNPINQLKRKIKQSNLSKRQPFKNLKDQELYEALETPKKTVQELESQNQELQDQNRQLVKTCEVYQCQIQDLQKQTNQKTAASNDLLRVRALEAARSEIRELRETLEEREQKIVHLEQSVQEMQLSLDKNIGRQKSVAESHELQIEKYKIMFQSVKREADARVDELQFKYKESLTETDKQKQKLLSLQQTQQFLVEGNDAKFKQQEERFHQAAQELKVVSDQVKQLQFEAIQSESHQLALQTELNQYRARCKQFESEAEQVRVRNLQNHSLQIASTQSANSYDVELKKLKERHAHQSLLLEEENLRLKNLVQSLSESEKQMQTVQSSSLLQEACQILSCDENQIVCSLQSLLHAQSTYQQQLNHLQEICQQKDLKLTHVSQRLAQQSQRVSTLEEHLKQSQQVASSLDGTSNFTKNLLHQKDVDIQNLKEQLSSMQDHEWDLQQELKIKEVLLSQSQQEKLQIQQELLSVRKSKQQAELNCQELKEKLRTQLQRQTETSFVKEAQESPRSKELIQAVLNLQIVQDPLSGMLNLQKSFYDDFDEALCCLEEQKKLVNGKLQSLAEQVEQLRSEQGQYEKSLQSKHELIVQLEQQILKQSQTFLDTLVECFDQSASEARTPLHQQIIERLPQQIQFNPLQERSGLHEEFKLLQQLQRSQCTQTESEQSHLDMLQKQLQEESQLKQDEHEIELQELAHKLRQEYHSQLQQLKDQHEFQVAEMEVQYQTKVDESFKDTPQLKQELRAAKTETQQVKKQCQDKITKMQSDFQSELQAKDNNLKEVIAELEAKHKAALKSQTEQASSKVRAEMMQRLTELKNEHARQQADWQRQRTKFDQMQGQLNDDFKREVEAQHQAQIKQSNAQIERVWRRKLDEMSKRCEEQQADYCTKLEQNAEVIKQLQVRLDQIKPQVVVNRSLEMPFKQSEGTQMSPLKPRRNSDAADNKFVVEMQTRLAEAVKRYEECRDEKEHQAKFIEQLKINFEMELERLDQQHQLDCHETVQSHLSKLQQLMSLEMDKILVTLQGQSQAQDRRQEINLKIKKLIGPDTKKLFDALKQKLALVLSTLKKQLVQKYSNQININDTESESQLVSDNQSSLTVQRQASSEEQVVVQSPQPNRNMKQRQSDLKNYLEFHDEQLTFQENEDPTKRLMPQAQNSRGAVVVEVEKVVRDLQMLYEATKMAKFCRVLLGPNQASDSQPQSARVSTENVVSAYRDLLNSFFRLIARLNQVSDQVCKDQEVFRLRLLNVDLKQQVNQLQKDQSGVVTRALVQDVITFYQKQEIPKIRLALESLEQLHFQISKNQFKLNQLADLFTREGRVNTNTQDVITKCEEFAQESDQFLESSFQNTQKYLSVEMMSPDETAHLIATVIQKMPNQSLSVTSEDIFKHALQICHDQNSVQMPPLQRLPRPHHRLATTTSQLNPSTIQTTTIQSRSRSTGMQGNNMPRQLLNIGSLYQTVEPHNQRYMQHEPKPSERYVTAELRQVPVMSMSQETDFLIEQGEDSHVQQHQSSLDEELACAQTNVNQLFDKIKGSKFNTLQY